MQRERFLPAAPEHKRVAAFQSHHPATLPGKVHQYGRDHLLGRCPARALADVDAFDTFRDQRQHPVADQGVVDDHIGAGQLPGRPQRQQVRVARSGADEHHRLYRLRRLCGDRRPRFGQPGARLDGAHDDVDEQDVGPQARSQAPARATDVDVVGALAPPDNAQLGRVGACAAVWAPGHVQPKR